MHGRDFGYEPSQISRAILIGWALRVHKQKNSTFGQFGLRNCGGKTSKLTNLNVLLFGIDSTY